MTPAQIAQIEQALRSVPYRPHEKATLDHVDYPALAALVASWVGPVETALEEATNWHHRRCDPECTMNNRWNAILRALPWRGPR